MENHKLEYIEGLGSLEYLEEMALSSDFAHTEEISDSVANIKELLLELHKYKQLVKQIGCPLEVRCKITSGLSIYDNYGQRWIIDDIEQECFEVHSAEDSYFLDKLRYKNYKVTWWLKADRSE